MKNPILPKLPVLLLAAVTAAGVATFTAAPASASAGTAYYRATPAAAPASPQLVAKELLWSCASDSCIAGKSASRPAIICSALVKVLGPVTAFSAGGQDFDPATLEKCNSRTN